MSSSSSTFLIRVRSNVGVWRVPLADGPASTTVQQLMDKIHETRPNVVFTKPLSSDPSCEHPLVENQEAASTTTLQQVNITQQGTMIHCRVDPDTCAGSGGVGSGSASGSADTSSSAIAATASTGTRRIIQKDGTIKVVASGESKKDNGFRKGMLALRDMKMAWTLNEFIAYDDQFVFKMKRQTESLGSTAISLDRESTQNFSNYLQRFQFSRARLGYLYGKYVDEEGEDEKDGKKQETATAAKSGSTNMEDTTTFRKKKVVVEAIYEPPQRADPSVPEGFELLEEDPAHVAQLERVEQIAQLLGLRKVGCIIGHPPRGGNGNGNGNGDSGKGEEQIVMTAAEVIMVAEMQLEDAGGVHETPFTTVMATLKDGNVSVEAYQVSKQCMEMVAEEALELDPTDRGVCVVNETFTAIQEGKESKTVDNAFFVTPVPIQQHSSEIFVGGGGGGGNTSGIPDGFPKLNRDLDDRTPSIQELKRQLQKSGSHGWTFIDLLSDFNMLVYLSEFLDMNDIMAKICASVKDNEHHPLDDGYKLILAGMAGLDSAY